MGISLKLLAWAFMAGIHSGQRQQLTSMVNSSAVSLMSTYPLDSDMGFCSCFQMHLNKFSLVPWCVSVCQRLWFQAADGGKKGGGDGEVFPSISNVLVPVGKLFWCSLPECRLCALAQSRDAVEGADGETGSVFAALVSRGSGVASIWDQSVSHPG